MRTGLMLATAALAVAGSFSAAAAAEPIRGSVGGYMMIGLAYQDLAGTDEVGVLRDGEIHLEFSGTADTGLTFRGRVELEACSGNCGGGADQIDENWAEVSGPWGAVRIGSENSAAENHERGVFYGPGARIGYFDSFYSVLFSDNGADSPMIRYYTPSVAGFAASVDWSPCTTCDGATDGGLVFGTDQRFTAGASWDGEFGDVGIGIGAGFEEADSFAETKYFVGAQISYAGFSFGVHYDSSAAGTDDAGFAVGAEYATGPWTFGGGFATLVEGPDLSNWGIWATYALAPGVTATLGYEGNDDSAVAGFETTVTGYLRISF